MNSPTQFIRKSMSVEYADGGDLQFWFDGNSKITGENGTFDNPAANSFSLPHVQTCPFATETCLRTCYVHGLKKNSPNTYDGYIVNRKSLFRLLDSKYCTGDDSLYLLGVRNFSEYIRNECPKGFRWHVSGDIVSPEHSQFIADVCRQTNDVPFWIYTRSFPFIEPVVGINNLVVNLSADQDNWRQAVEASKKHSLRICYLTVDGTVPDLPEGSVIFPDYSLRGRELENPTSAPWWQSLTGKQRGMVCPPDFFGQSEHLRCGPCKKCLVNTKPDYGKYYEVRIDPATKGDYSVEPEYTCGRLPAVRRIGRPAPPD